MKRYFYFAFPFIAGCALLDSFQSKFENQNYDKVKYSYFIINPEENSGTTTVAGKVNALAALNPYLHVRVETINNQVVGVVTNNPKDEEQHFWIFVPKRPILAKDVQWTNFSKDFYFHGLIKADTFFPAKYPSSKTLAVDYKINDEKTKARLNKIFQLSYPYKNYFNSIVLGEESPELTLRLKEQYAYESDVDERKEFSGPVYAKVPAACLVKNKYGMYRRSFGHSPSFFSYANSIISYAQGLMDWSYIERKEDKDLMTDYAYVSKLKNEWVGLEEKLKSIKSMPKTDLEFNYLLAIVKEVNERISITKEQSDLRHPASIYRDKAGNFDSKVQLLSYLFKENGNSVKHATWENHNWIVVNELFKERVNSYSNELAIYVNQDLNVEPLIEETGSTPYFLCPPIPNGKVSSINFHDYTFGR